MMAKAEPKRWDPRRRTVTSSSPVSHVALASIRADGTVEPEGCEYINEEGAEEAKQRVKESG